MAAKSKVGSQRAPLGVDAAQGSRVGRGRTKAGTTPLAVHTQGVVLPAALEQHIRAKLGTRLAKYAVHIERVTARFEDMNGPRGGIDTECRVQVALVSRPTIVVHERARDARRAFDGLIDSLTRAVGRDLERAGFSERGSAVRRTKADDAAPVRAAKAKKTDAEEPRRAPKPSRISTRGSSPDGLRSGIGLAKRAQARTISPESKAAKAAVNRRGVR